MLELAGLLLLGVATLLYWLGKRRYSYWVERGVPQPPPVFGFGHFKDAFLGKLNHGLIIHDIYRSFPKADAVGVYELFTPKLVIRSPELLKKVLMSDFSSFHDNELYVKESIDPFFSKDPFVLRGEEWKPGRAKLIPFLTYNRLKEIYPTMKEVIPRLYNYVEQNTGKDLEVKELASLFMMDTISSCVFGISSNCFIDPNAPFRKMGDFLIQEQFTHFWQVTILMRFQKLRDLLGYRFIPKRVTDFIDDMVSAVVKHRSETKTFRSDLMQHMINHYPGQDSKDRMEIATTFFLEAFETTASVASSVLYELALNPKIQTSLRDEIEDNFPNKSDIDIHILWNMPYLDKVIKETMRKHSVFFSLQKLCTKDAVLDICGKQLNISAGTTIFIPLYSLHHDPEYWPEPDVFDPERFSDEEKSTRPACTFMPFGEGPRTCVGFRLGLIQVKVFIANLVGRYKVLPADSLPSKLTYDEGSLTATPKEQRCIRLEAII